MKFIKKCVIGIFSLIFISGTIYGIDYREEMRQFVISLSRYAESTCPGFLLIPQNGQEILTMDGETEGPVHRDYLKAIDAIGREDLFFGYRRDNRKTPSGENRHLLEWCRLYKEKGIPVLVTDYCSDEDKMDESRRLNGENGFISFTAPERELNEIPPGPDLLSGENRGDILSAGEVRNFLYLINGEKFSTKKDFLSTVKATNYDLIIMDLFLSDEALNEGDLEQIRKKQNGGRRLLICYMSIGEAEDYRFYWKKDWEFSPPAWLKEENPNWEGNYKVRYWDPDWQSIIFGNPEAYLDRILAAGFDGVYLDIIDAFEYFE